MNHIAIMRKHWGLTNRIRSGEATAIARFYAKRIPPWGRVNEGDLIYFMDAGHPITARAEVEGVLQLENLTPERVRGILADYSERMALKPIEVAESINRFCFRRYGILIFLKNHVEVEAFRVDKARNAAHSTWLVTEDVTENIRAETYAEGLKRMMKLYEALGRRLKANCRRARAR